MKVMNLAILSPALNAYSETFIQVHKQIPGAKVFFYYGGLVPKMLEGEGSLFTGDMISRMRRFLNEKFLRSDFSFEEYYLFQSLKKNKIACVLAEYGTTGASALKVCRKNNLPLVTIFHGFDASIKSVLEENKEAYQELFSYSRKIIVVSKAMETRLIHLGCPPDKILYNPYGPNSAFFNVHPQRKCQTFIGVGRFVDKKAPYYTLLAFSKVLSKYPRARLVIGGDGPLWNSCINLARYLKIENNVVFPGVITPELLRQYFTESVAFVQHSITAENGDMEGTPVGVLEASAAGLPVVSTLHAGIPDVIINGVTGFLVKEHDVDGMAESMIKLLDEPALAEEMGLRGREIIKKHFSLSRHLDILSEVIKQSVY